MSKLTDNDKNWGPFTVGPWTGRFSVEWSSGGGEDEEGYRNHLRICAFGKVFQVKLPNLLPPWRKKVMALSWDEDTVKRLGRNWYWHVEERRFGFALSNMGNGYDFLQVFFGPQTMDSRTTKSWSKHLPWKMWDCVRTSVYNPDGSHFATEDRKNGAWKQWYEMREKCPQVHFGFEDYDGEMIVASCRIEEMEWRKGSGWFKWLRLFAKPKIRRSLDLHFSAEVGPEKGSWKGGTIGHGIEMLRGETPEQAFRRYCSSERDARRGKKYRIRFIGPCAPPPKKVYSDQECGSEQNAKVSAN